VGRFGLCGSSYRSQSPNADDQVLVNFILEQDESQQGKAAFYLYPSPGLALFSALGDTPLRGWGLFIVNGGTQQVQSQSVKNIVSTSIVGSSRQRCFAVAGSSLYEVFADGTNLFLGTIANDGNPVSMCSSSQQLFLASAGLTYALNLTTNIFAAINQANFVDKVTQVGYCDGFFLALIANSNKFQVSTLLDCTSWNLANITAISVFPDNAIALFVDHREPWLFCATKSVVYYDSGNADFPFDVVPGGYIEQGSVAQFSPVHLDNSIFWIGGDERGSGIGWRAQGYTPTRVTDFATELAWQSYPTISDAVSYSFQMNGHSFWHVYFPTADASWRYDVSNNKWSQVDSFINGISHAHKSCCHAFVFGKHLVGDPTSGNIYQMAIPVLVNGSWTFADDAGNPIRRVRRAPPISSENKWIRLDQLEIDMETGLGNAIDPGSDPQIMLRWSKDGGHTWSQPVQLSAGKIGEYRKRVIQRRLGIARSWIFEISVTDPIPWRIIDGYLQGTGFQVPTERLSKQLGKSA
jgi:hypothetical protein